MRLLRTIQLDASDSFVFEKAAEPGEWAVSGAFAFARDEPADLRGKARSAFRAGFLGLASLGRSTLVQIVEASEADRGAIVDMLAAQLVAHFGAPDVYAARPAAEAAGQGGGRPRRASHQWGRRRAAGRGGRTRRGGLAATGRPGGGGGCSEPWHEARSITYGSAA